MHVKWFFTIVGIFLVILMLIGMYFVGDMLSRQNDENSERQMNQSKTQYEEAMNTTLAQFYTQNNNTANNFNRSIIIHDFLYKAINKTTGMLDPLLEQIPNATQSRVDQEAHYNQSNELSDIIHAMGNNTEIIEQNNLERKLLGDVNRTLFILIDNINGGEISNSKPFVINNITQPK